MDNVTITRPYEECHVVSLVCPVEYTTLGYYPNAGINYFFAVVYGLATLALLVTGLWKRTWSYSGFLAAGAALEMAGYAARVPLHDNPWNQQAFETQICAIILAPTLICVGLYLTLQHVCLALCPELSRIRPTWYPWIFVPADVSCLLVQAIGGALAASAGYTNQALVNAGNRAIIAGIALQVVVLGLFGAAGLDYYLRVRRLFQGRDPLGRQPTDAARALWADKRFNIFLRAVVAAYSCVLIRCIYRIAEMAGGWGNKIMQDEPSFIVLEGFMILLAVCFLAAVPPGVFFPLMALGKKQRKAKAEAEAVQSMQSAAVDSERPNSGHLEAGTAQPSSDEALHEK